MEKRSNGFKFMHGELKLDALFKLIWQNKKIYVYVLLATFVLSAGYAVSLPRYYETKVLLAPEYSSGSSSFGSIGGLASLAGINLGNMGGEDAIVPSLYPDLISSTDFLVSMFDVQIVTRDTTYQGTLRRYMETCQKEAWWTEGILWIKNLFQKKEQTDSVAEPDPFQLTKEETILAQNIGKKLNCLVDKKTNVITLTVTDQDPLVSALLVDTLRSRLQNFITNYRTQKARNDLQYLLQLRDEAALQYKEKQNAYATYSDANMELFLETNKSHLAKLKSEAQTSYDIYNQLLQRVEIARAKVLERTPAFTVVQNATVPLKPAGPRRTLIVLAFCMLAFMGTTGYIIVKK